MILYIQSIDYNLWLSIENGPHKPTKNENDITICKPRSEYTDSDKKLFSIDVKTMNNLYCILSIKVTHKGTNQVKESKIDICVYQYELFKMLSNEFTIITNSLNALGSTYINTNIVRKNLRSFLKYWKTKVIII
ncbi:hypothetical protein NC653_034565 [Populus alba x Populus x berolinensis]|uniref:Uncharacterized protein n=1 Tax=Populus alba x Populus x berolinensis TaxID=444605 RepID=A0AAD6LP31_9ROSI|nr:hypothetical protein NC653_034565 [Populus alba x Populus x berolinensis]